jgi:hypothetical protein
MYRHGNSFRYYQLVWIRLFHGGLARIARCEFQISTSYEVRSLMIFDQDYGCYIVDRRSQSVEDSVEQLVSCSALPLFVSVLTGFYHRRTNCCRSPPRPDDSVSTSVTGLSDYPSCSTGKRLVSSMPRLGNLLCEELTRILSVMTSPTLWVFTESAFP